MKALEELGIIQGFVAQLDDHLLGGERCDIRVRADLPKVEDVARAILEIPGVEELALIPGGQLHIRARFVSPDATLAGFHARAVTIDGIRAFETAPILRIERPKGAPVWLDSLAVTCHHCGGPIERSPARLALDGRTHVFCCLHCLASFRERHDKTKAKTKRTSKSPRPHKARRT